MRVTDPLAEMATGPFVALAEGVERTRHGAMMLPDTSRFGPMYWAVFETTDDVTVY